MLKAVIFDFDGVIADSELLHYKALNAIFKPFGIDVPQQMYWDKYLGYNDVEAVEAISRDYNILLSPEHVDKALKKKAEIFEELVKAENTIFQGVVEFVEMLKANGIRRAVCSGAILNDIKIMLEDTVLKDAFEVIVTADDVKKGKPDPQGYLLTLNRLNDSGEKVGLDECVVIEDSHWGLEAAIAAGMKTIAVTNSYPKAQLADFTTKVVDRLNEITIDVLRSIC